MSLVARGMSHAEFAERCGVSLGVLKGMLRSGIVSGEVANGYTSLVAGEDLVGSEEAGVGSVFGRPVRNDRLQVIEFTDGSKGYVRKKRDFKPRFGLPCEVEASDEEGFMRLIGRYRDNGVRLDG